MIIFQSVVPWTKKTIKYNKDDNNKNYNNSYNNSSNSNSNNSNNNNINNYNNNVKNIYNYYNKMVYPKNLTIYYLRVETKRKDIELYEIFIWTISILKYIYI